MKRQVRDWTIKALFRERSVISFPEYQRQPNLWSLEDNALLIDSILQGIDIPKLYFNKTEDGYEVVDGQQRLWAIWRFLDDEFTVTAGSRQRAFSQLPAADRRTVEDYKLQVVIYENANDDFLRQVFLRLQLGVLLITGEKLHAQTGEMKRLVFDTLKDHPFIQSLAGIPNRRFAKETVAAQICINSFSRAQSGKFARTRYEDLNSFFTKFREPTGLDLQLFNDLKESIPHTMTELYTLLGNTMTKLRNRAYIMSVYFLFEELNSGGQLRSQGDREAFAQFVRMLWTRLREEMRKGIDRTNRHLYAFETLISSAPGEKYQIERRHEEMLKYFEYYKAHGKIKGD